MGRSTPSNVASGVKTHVSCARTRIVPRVYVMRTVMIRPAYILSTRCKTKWKHAYFFRSFFFLHTFSFFSLLFFFDFSLFSFFFHTWLFFGPFFLYSFPSPHRASSSTVLLVTMFVEINVEKLRTKEMFGSGALPLRRVAFGLKYDWNKATH